ncbi:MAG TPA: nuclear transport factor 2 family protein [Candidatus Acidoferrales bacterium]|nr:nuclear transport factor 2 family protein [Candidatus Acidoferrales bacterium]
MKSSDIQARKHAAAEFLQLVIAGKFDEAYGKYVDMDGRHHNVFFQAGFTTLKKAMAENHVQFPDKKLTIKNIIGDDDLVAVHSHLMFKSGEKGMVVVHMFRFKDDKIVEMWDYGQVIPDDSPNKDGAF